MNTGIKRICNYPGCNKISISTYCAEHQAIKDQQKKEKEKKYDEKRGSSYSRGYDKNWEKVRKMKLAMNPVCELCNKYEKLIVHHLKPISEGGEKYDFNNLQTLCAECHYKIHREL